VSRLDKIQSQLESSSTIKSTRDTWKESLALLKELDPDIALTHQQQPLLYKRQQVLASSTQLEEDMKQLDTVLKLITTDSTSSSGPLRLDQIVQAPIVSSYKPIAPADEKRLENLRSKQLETQQRIQTLQQTLQLLLESYHVCMTACSEKLILASEQYNANK
jgi:hypothetical protein